VLDSIVFLLTMVRDELDEEPLPPLI